MDKPVLNVRANLHKYKMKLSLVSLSISMVEENTSMWITPQHLLVLSYGRPDFKLCHCADWGRRVVAVTMFPS